MKELKKEKEYLEKQILELIEEFELIFECCITEVNLLHTGGRTLDGELNAHTAQVNVKFDI